MENNIPKCTSINIRTPNGNRISASKCGENIVLKTDEKHLDSALDDKLIDFIENHFSTLEKAPRRDTFLKTKKAKKDKAMMRALLYSNPIINPFGCYPTRGGFEPVIKNPVIEGFLTQLYGRGN